MFPVIGMSPGNSYFKQETIDKLLEHVLAEYARTAVFIPDIPAIATYVALGYPQNRARRDKALPQGNALRNRVLKVIDAHAIEPNRVRIFDWEKEGIESNAEYQKAFVRIRSVYEENAAFKADADQATAEVLIDNPFRKQEIGPTEVQQGVHYLLSEIAFMQFLPDFLEEPSVAYAYHRPWPVFEKYIVGTYDGEVKSRLGFIQLPDFS